MERWYALYAKAYKEHQVSNFLQSRGYETYLPTIAVRKNGQEKTVPFFSCYLFVRVNPSNGFSSVRWTPGLRRIVSFGEQPAVVDDEAVSFLRQRLVEMQQSGCEAYPFEPGDRVVITSGPLRGSSTTSCLPGTGKMRLLCPSSFVLREGTPKSFVSSRCLMTEAASTQVIA